jgi:hypothetical protein
VSNFGPGPGTRLTVQLLRQPPQPPAPRSALSAAAAAAGLLAVRGSKLPRWSGIGSNRIRQADTKECRLQALSRLFRTSSALFAPVASLRIERLPATPWDHRQTKSNRSVECKPQKRSYGFSGPVAAFGGPQPLHGTAAPWDHSLWSHGAVPFTPWDRSSMGPQSPTAVRQLHGTTGPTAPWDHWSDSSMGPLVRQLHGTTGPTAPWDHWSDSSMGPLFPQLHGATGSHSSMGPLPVVHGVGPCRLWSHRR